MWSRTCASRTAVTLDTHNNRVAAAEIGWGPCRGLYSLYVELRKFGAFDARRGRLRVASLQLRLCFFRNCLGWMWGLGSDSDISSFSAVVRST